MSFVCQVVKPKDLSRIDVNHVGELLWWSYQLGTTPEKLVTIVDEVGPSADLVTSQLQNGNFSS
jgi:Protein of unknown function (DUF3606)